MSKRVIGGAWGAIGVAAWALAGGAAAANIVPNGGFDGGVDPWFFVHNEKLTDITHSASLGHTAPGSVRFSAGSGREDDLVLNPFFVPTVAGQEYLLSFWVYNEGAGGDFLGVTWEGFSVLNEFPVAHPLEQWDMVTLSVVATTDGSGLRFGGYDDSGAWYLDDVSLVAVPGPGAAALAACGGVLAARRRRR